MMRNIIFCLLVSGAGQALAQTQMSYEAWLDSMESDSYIAREIWLDDLEIKEKSAGVAQSSEAANADELLENMTGVSLVKRGYYAAEPILQGLSSERYEMKIDGMTIAGACTDKMDPVSSYVEGVNLRSLRIGAAGEQAKPAVQFNLKKPVFRNGQRFEGGAGISFGSVAGAFDQTADFNFSQSKYAARFSLVHRKSGDVRIGGGETVPNSGFEKWNYVGAFSWLLSDSRLLTFSFLGDDAFDVGYPALPMDVAYARAKAFSLELFQSEAPLLTDLEVKLYFNVVKHAMDDSRRDVVMRMDMPGETNTAGFYIRGDLLKTKNTLRAKLDAYRTFSSAEMTMFPENEKPMYMLTWPDVVKNSIEAAFFYDYALTESLTLKGSAAVELGETHMTSDLGKNQFQVFGYASEQKGLQWMPSASATAVFSRSFWTIDGGISFSQRLPSVSEKFGYFLFNAYDGYDYLGNPELAKETSFTSSAGVSFNVSTWEARVRLFHTVFDDYILAGVDELTDAMTPGASGLKTYENTSYAAMTGGEAWISVNLLQYIALEASAEYVRGDDYTGGPLPMMPPLSGSFSAGFQKKSFYIKPEMEWAATQSRVSSRFGELSTGAFAVFHIKTGWELKLDAVALKLGARVENLTDRLYRQHLDWGNLARPGRNLALDIKVRF